MNEMIIGITGLARSGKDAAARLFIQKGFTQINMSDILKEELLKKNIEPTKENMSLLGDELRKLHGKDIIIKMLVNKLKGREKIVITGIRSPEEAAFLKQQVKNFCLLAIGAKESIRFSRRTAEDPQTEQEFFSRDQRDIKNKGLDKVIASAEITTENNASLEELNKKLESFLSALAKKR